MQNKINYSLNSSRGCYKEYLRGWDPVRVYREGFPKFCVRHACWLLLLTLPKYVCFGD